jgi:hypothetical protein
MRIMAMHEDERILKDSRIATWSAIRGNRYAQECIMEVMHDAYNEALMCMH